MVGSDTAGEAQCSLCHASEAEAAAGAVTETETDRADEDELQSIYKAACQSGIKTTGRRDALHNMRNDAKRFC